MEENDDNTYYYIQQRSRDTLTALLYGFPAAGSFLISLIPASQHRLVPMSIMSLGPTSIVSESSSSVMAILLR